MQPGGRLRDTWPSASVSRPHLTAAARGAGPWWELPRALASSLELRTLRLTHKNSTQRCKAAAAGSPASFLTRRTDFPQGMWEGVTPPVPPSTFCPETPYGPTGAQEGSPTASPPLPGSSRAVHSCFLATSWVRGENSAVRLPSVCLVLPWLGPARGGPAAGAPLLSLVSHVLFV